MMLGLRCRFARGRWDGRRGLVTVSSSGLGGGIGFPSRGPNSIFFFAADDFGFFGLGEHGSGAAGTVGDFLRAFFAFFVRSFSSSSDEAVDPLESLRWRTNPSPSILVDSDDELFEEAPYDGARLSTRGRGIDDVSLLADMLLNEPE